MTLTQEQLAGIGRKVFATRESTLEQEAAGLDAEEMRTSLLNVRRQQRETLGSLPDHAFAAQQSGDGEDAWTAGQITVHLANAFSSMSGFIRPILGMPEATVAPRDVSQQLDRDETLLIHDTIDAALAEFFSTIPSDADQSQTATHPRFGEIGPRGMLLLMLIHETDHLRQMRRLSTS